LRDVDNVDNPSKMSSRAMRKLQGENLEQELEKIHMKTEEADVDSNEEEDYDVGGGGGGARPKQRRNPFEMVGTVGGAARVEQGRDSPIFLQFFYLFSIFFLNRF
jgi:hypothetical protein